MPSNHPSRSRTCRPRELLRAWGRQWPDIWRAIDAARQQGHDKWPEYVYLPLEAAGLVMAKAWLAQGRHPQPGIIVRDASELVLYSAWRVTQGVFRYDPTLYESLIETPIANIPADVLRRLPEWCVYVETPGMSIPLVGGGDTALHGAWAWMDWQADGERDILTLGLDPEGANVAIAHVPLGGTLDEGLAEVERQWADNWTRGIATEWHAGYAEAAQKALAPVLSLVLYLAAENADFGEGRPERPRPKRTKQGWRLFPADKPTIWEVGVRLGAALRRAYQTDEDAAGKAHAGPRPHIRRAHWHTYLTGTGRANRVLRWLPPIPVNVANVDELPSTVKPVAP